MGLTQSSEEPAPDIKKSSEIKFYLQDREHTVQTDNIDPGTSLNSYLRDNLHMKGTKYMCLEGGCGSCVVVLQNTDPITQKEVTLAVNSCLVPLFSCNGWKITTIEGIGNPLDGYHPIQETLAKFNGTQCGFCSPGMVMNMYALSRSGKFTMKEVENSFSGNICRCTGYRSILTAFKSLATDADPTLLGTCSDIEDLRKCFRENCEKVCATPCVQMVAEPFYVEAGDSKWLKVHALKDLFTVLNLQPSVRYKIVAGNTAQGVYTSYKATVDLYIDVTDIPELKVHQVDANSCVLGANITLTDTIEFFNQTSQQQPKFAYLKQMADHIDLVANVPVRNRATIAGNLMIKHDHHDFPSDIFLLLETVGAQITIVNTNNVETTLSPLEFINRNMNRTIIKTITLKPLPPPIKFVSYKIMPRAQNVHAIVNAGFLFGFADGNTLRNATIVFGNINRNFVHATKSEQLLKNKNLFDNNVLKQVYDSLNSELVADFIPPDPSPKSRKKLAIALFYKAVLSIAPAAQLSPRNKSGGPLLERPVSSGIQDYETKESLYPLTKPIPKVEALAQTSGQAQYVDDLPTPPFQLYAALVLAAAAPNSTISEIDASAAMKSDEIVAFYTKNDIPGDNIFTTIMPLVNSEEELFCSGRVLYYNQPIGVLVGKNRRSVHKAVQLVDVKYDAPNVEPLLTIRQVLKEGRTDRVDQFKVIDAKSKGNNIKHVIKGTFDIYHQYHFHMETQCCLVFPNEQGVDIYATTQWMDLVQFSVARVLGLQTSQVNVTVRRCGGAFGGKISRNSLVACATALAAWKLRLPVKMTLPLQDNMDVLGKRWPCTVNYEVGVDDEGLIQYFTCDQYTDVGAQLNEDNAEWIEKIIYTIYKSDSYTLRMNKVVTDTPTNTWCRAPGSVEAIAILENLMEDISYKLNIDPLMVRQRNISDKTPIAKYITDIKSWADLDKRKADIASFNQANRWKKRGISVVLMSFDIIIIGPYLTTVVICQGDGSVQISHGGIEIGQGVNTKAAQVAAYKFKIPMEKITVIPSNSFISINSMTTGGSVTSDAICYGVEKACDVLLERMKPYQTNGAKWEDVVKECHKNSVNLLANSSYGPTSPEVKEYSVYGICATEVLVDILTGQHLVTRVDLIQDTGVSLNPIIDVGQAEGAFVMGLGYNVMEKIVFNFEGKNLTNNTWTYYPPGAKDIPIDFRVKFPKNNPNPVGVLKSKGTGEPAMSFGIGLQFALRNALASARKDASQSNAPWFPIDGPTTVETVILNTLNDSSQYTL